MVNTFNSYILLLFDCHAPERKIILKEKPKPSTTDTLKYMMSLRDALVKTQLFKTKSREKSSIPMLERKYRASVKYYRSLRNLVTATTKREKKAYYNNFINKHFKKPHLL